METDPPPAATLARLMEESRLSIREIERRTGLSYTTARDASKGHPVRIDAAGAILAAIGRKWSDLENPNKINPS